MSGLCIGGMKMYTDYTILVCKPERKRPFGRPRHRWRRDIKMDLKSHSV
jgi:hypothetical protein